MKFTPRPFQTVAIDHAHNVLIEGGKQLYAAPTGVGKSVVELGVKSRLPGTWIVTPREEIIDGMLDKLGFADADSLAHQMATPIKLRNRLLSGEVEPPPYLIFDEGHHHNAESWQQVELLAGLCPSVAYTATPYRGTPKSTKQFREVWGEPLWLITHKEAADEGYISVPRFEILPLVDDDIVEVKGGEFDVTSLDGVTVDRLGDAADHAKQWYNGIWDRPTMFALPSSESCRALKIELDARGLPSVIVSATTPKSQRRSIFEAVVNRLVCLLQINIVSEGVDLPMRRLVDMAPTLSPVKWVQQLGRIERPVTPGEPPPEYICTNRNVLRHAYALDGVVPIAIVAEAEKKFPTTSRAHVRSLGLEALGRFKPATTKLLNGLNIHTYAMSAVQGNVVVEFCAIVHPCKETVWAAKINTVVDGVKTWGKWNRCDAPNNIVGFSSLGQREPSPKQFKWWQRSAASFGLDPDQEVTRKSFQALPVLCDIGDPGLLL